MSSSSSRWGPAVKSEEKDYLLKSATPNTESGTINPRLSPKDDVESLGAGCEPWIHTQSEQRNGDKPSSVSPSNASISHDSTRTSNNGNNNNVKNVRDDGGEGAQHYYNRIYDEFELIDEVEWGPRKGEPGYDDDQELAPKPRKCLPDPCGCQPVGIEYTDTGIILHGAKHMTCNDDTCILFAIQEECGSNCEAGPTCGNKRLQRKQFCDVEVFDAGLKGRGLRISKNGTCNKGDIVCEYVGRAVTATHLSRLFRRYERDRRLYIMALGDGVYLDARHKGGLARYINHSCDPNCRVERWKVKGVVRAAVVALRDIQPQEELTFDYQWERKRGHAPTICHCGSATCRGTLEAPKSLEEQDLQKELEAHWEQNRTADETIINRTVQVFSSEHQEYFIGEVTGYDANKKLHCIFYRHDMNEVWEDLHKENWMILNEKKDKEHFMIARKVRRSPSTCLLIGATKESVATPAYVKNCLYVQTPIKEGMWSYHLIERCERNCGVQIQAEQQARPPLNPNLDDPEEVEKFAALDQSLDDTVWKLTITGSNIPKALTILEKNKIHLERKLAALDETQRATSTGSNQTTTNMARPLQSINTSFSADAHEVIFPRQIADAVKRRLNTVREKCRNVTISFVASYSKSKQFAKLLLDGAVPSDIEVAKEHLWSLLVTLCSEANVPLTPNMIYRDLAFLGGTLTSEQFHVLCSGPKARLSIDACEDLNFSPFIKSFESTYRCTVWIQSQEDQGRIDASNKIVNEPSPNSPRKLFFGCVPKDARKLGALIVSRANELSRGVKYIYLGIDRVYQALMLKNGAKFFEYVNEVSGALVTIDPMTGDHLRIDGRWPQDRPVDLEDETRNLTEAQRADLAEELIRLQIEVYRDHCIRQYPWIFGRDWSLVAVASLKVTDGSETRSGFGSIGTLDKKTVSQCGTDIAEIVARLGLPASVAAHACLILYRFTYVNEHFVSNIRSREAVLACVYLANKTYNFAEWKRLETVLEAGYQTFYPGSNFNRASEEAVVLEDKVIAAEKEILDTLQYDIFWQSIEGLRSTAARAGKMKKDSIEAVLEFAFCGQVLSAGAELWLKYGVEYIFAVAAAFLKADLSDLLPALSLIPLKVSQAAELLVETAKFGKHISKETPSHSLLEGCKDRLEKYLPRIKQDCVEIMKAAMLKQVPIIQPSISKEDEMNKIIGDECSHCKIARAVSRAIVRSSILPVVDKIAVESSCSIFIGEDADGARDDIVFQGPWRSIAVAYHLIKETLPGDEVLPPLEDYPNDPMTQAKLQAKSCPGFLNASDIETSDGWEGSIQLSYADDGRLGGKHFVAAKVDESALRKAGFRWLIPSKYCPSPTGAISDMSFPSVERSQQLSLLGDLAVSLVGKSETFPLLTTLQREIESSNRFMPISVQRWPPEKVCLREVRKWNRVREKSMQIGFSPAALQEMQLLRQLHSNIQSVQGHPNIVLPVGIAIPGEKDGLSANRKSPEDDIELSPDDAVFSLFRSSEDNEKAAKRSKKIKESPSLIFNPAPLTFHRILSRKVMSASEKISPTILVAWFHDCISMLAHCHSNNIILCTLHTDQILIDQSGMAKLGCLYRCSKSLTEDGIENSIEYAEALSKARSARRKDDQDDYTNDLYIAPETLLGSPRYTKESDVWAVGSLLANLLLNRPLFSGRDRESFLNSQYKIVGTPAKANFPDSVKYPYYFKPMKKYVHTVQKALRHLLKDDAVQYEKAIDLVAQMLHLDPQSRCTAMEALNHDFLTQYRENRLSIVTSERFASDWMSLKRIIMKSKDIGQGQSDDTKVLKRNAMLMAASTAVEDDLYDMEDILADTSKKQKH